MLSQNRQTISVAQALLILIDKYIASARCAELKKLYVLGAVNEDDIQILQTYLNDDALKDYNISRDYKIINEDASRRYFETHFAFQMLQHELNQLGLPVLNEFYTTLFQLFPQEQTLQSELTKVLAGDTSIKHPYWSEYADAIQRLNSTDEYKMFSGQQKEKLLLLMKISYMAVKYTSMHNDTLPIAIYKKDLFATENRGKLMKDGQTTTDAKGTTHVVTSSNFGLLKNYMPIPAHDIANSETQFKFTRPADQSTFCSNSLWARENFQLLVHPYSNSISGTLLCLFRVLKHIHASQDKLIFNDEHNLTVYLRCNISALIFNSGGHSFNEFVAVLNIPDVKSNMTFITGFANINAASLLLNPASNALDLALRDTIVYNKILLAKTQAHEFIRTAPGISRKPQ